MVPHHWLDRDEDREDAMCNDRQDHTVKSPARYSNHGGHIDCEPRWQAIGKARVDLQVEYDECGGDSMSR